MKMWKRIFTSLVRRPYQMLFVFLTVFILGNVLFASIAVQQASNQVKNEMRSRISGEISITYNEDLYRVNNGVMMRMKDFVNDFDSLIGGHKYHMWKRINVLPTYEADYVGAWYDLKYLYGTSNIDDLINGLQIESGRNYTQEDFESDRFKIVLPYQMEDYQIGDTIQYGYVYDTVIDNEVILRLKRIDFEIIGIANGYIHPTDDEFFCLSSYCSINLY